MDDEEEPFIPIHREPTGYLPEDLEQASVDKFIPSSNLGYKLIKKMGWEENTGLGKNRTGIVDPIQLSLQIGTLGVGALQQDEYYINPENIHRRKLESEVEETEEVKQKRQAQADHEEKKQSELAQINKVFYCELCDKQYHKATEWDIHLSSYDHHHKKRFQEMKKSLNSLSKSDREKKQKAREEKELKQLELQRQRALAATTAKPVVQATEITGNHAPVKFSFGSMKTRKRKR